MAVLELTSQNFSQSRLADLLCPVTLLQCGSCWAFAATAALESKLMIASGEYVDLSEQQLVDCVNAAAGFTASQGCGGGWPEDAFSFAHLSGQTSEGAYPYTAAAGQCQSGSGSSAAKIVAGPGYVKLEPNSATALMRVSAYSRQRHWLPASWDLRSLPAVEPADWCEQ